MSAVISRIINLGMVGARAVLVRHGGGYEASAVLRWGYEPDFKSLVEFLRIGGVDGEYSPKTCASLGDRYWFDVGTNGLRRSSSCE